MADKRRTDYGSRSRRNIEQPAPPAALRGRKQIGNRGEAQRGKRSLAKPDDDPGRYVELKVRLTAARRAPTRNSASDRVRMILRP